VCQYEEQKDLGPIVRWVNEKVTYRCEVRGNVGRVWANRKGAGRRAESRREGAKRERRISEREQIACRKRAEIIKNIFL
jgi:hypothetical protein